MHKKIVSTCSHNTNMYWVCIQYIVEKFLVISNLVTTYVPRIDVIFYTHVTFDSKHTLTGYE